VVELKKTNASLIIWCRRQRLKSR